MKRTACCVIVFLSILFLLTTTAWSPPVIRHIYYQKKTTLAYPSSPTLKFSLWDEETEGMEVWSEEKRVSLTSNTIKTYLGDANPFDDVALDFSRQYWVQVDRKTRAGYVPLGERDRLGITPYSFWSVYGNEVPGPHTHTAGEITSGQFGSDRLSPGAVTKPKLNASGEGTSGQVLGTDGTYLVWQDAGTGPGGLTLPYSKSIDADGATAFYLSNTGDKTGTPPNFGIPRAIEGRASGTEGVGVQGLASGSASYGVYGRHASTGNYGYVGGIDAGVAGFSSASGSLAGGFKGPVKIWGRTDFHHPTVGNKWMSVRTDGTMVDLQSSGYPLAINYGLEDPQNTYLNVNGGSVGIGIAGADVQDKLHVKGVTRFDVASGRIMMSTPQGSPGIIGYANNGNRRDIRFYNGSMTLGVSSSASAPADTVAITPGNVAFKGNVQIVSASTGETLIELGEGLDYAEGFHVSDKDKIKPGSVLIIDSDNPGKLKLSESPYDTRVAGIAAGGKGLGSAVRLGVGQFDHDVALAGRVYCNVDSNFGEIKPGDLLTTSPTPGYAMVVKDHTKAQGAILGKAMEKLPQGEKGQILVLVTLQ